MTRLTYRAQLAALYLLALAVLAACVAVVAATTPDWRLW